MEDLYKVLGVEKSSTQDEIKKAYRNLAFKYHPDRNQGRKDAEEKLKEINAAYSVLGDPEKRRQYDATGFNTSYSSNNSYGNYQRGYYDPYGKGQNQYGYEDFDNIFRSFYENSSRNYNSTYSTYGQYKKKQQSPLTLGEGILKLITGAITGLLGLLSLNITLWFFPIGPILSIAAIVNGFSNVTNGLRAISKALTSKYSKK